MQWHIDKKTNVLQVVNNVVFGGMFERHFKLCNYHFMLNN